MGIHKWDNYKSVKSILPILHAKGWEQMHNHNEFMNRKGRECYYCKKQQYAVFVSLYIGTKYYNTIRPKVIKLPADHKTIYNGQEVKWFVGDRNTYRAFELECAYMPDEKTYVICDEDGFYWEAWGSCNGRPYQMFAWYNRHTGEIIDPYVLPAKNTIKKLDGSIIQEPAYYFDQKTYDLLTKPKLD